VPAWWSDSGGIPYHLRALRYRQEGWIPHRLELEKRLRKTLSQYHPEQVVWIGLSGAHELSSEFLRSLGVPQYVIEPDPLARMILKMKRVNATFDSRPLTPSEAILLRLPKESRNKRTWIVFANLLGQVPEVSWDWSVLLQDVKGVATSWQDRFSSSEAGVLIDHECISPFPGHEEQGSWTWNLTPTRRHEIEWGNLSLD
jgi:hypothetical protein